MTPETARAWIRVGRDLLLVMIGSGMLVFGTIAITDKERLTIVLGTGIFACSLPVAFRWGQLFASGFEEPPARTPPVKGADEQ